MFTKILSHFLPSTSKTNYVSAGHVDFVGAGLAEYNDHYAVVFDSLFTEAELTAILAEAEASAPWDVAQVNAGAHAYTDTSYRNGQRIIYDSHELSQRIFDKIRPHLQDIEEIEQPTYLPGPEAGRPEMAHGPAERAAALPAETGQRTFYTLQFYLPSDASGSKESFQPPIGGSTRFRGRIAEKAFADVESIPGRVLVFQHANLLHTGEEVTSGIKCTVRSDILYERVGEPVPIEES
ncbi:alcohol dehydrogenase [Mycena indigotica]|uniref:Alcohol dehydrogenase n=1 Tax=Mycena indigotica TaxID=2126181 RepID=A0A8H6S0W2_9AGAR|nr:alcohol dehydrogenase [Mycena indigotica]KAF7289842.1 alcohol dehydrogenase [Mycena indigotica]